jgi:hypothetical protein
MVGRRQLDTASTPTRERFSSPAAGPFGTKCPRAGDAANRRGATIDRVKTVMATARAKLAGNDPNVAASPTEARGPQTHDAQT